MNKQINEMNKQEFLEYIRTKRNIDYHIFSRVKKRIISNRDVVIELCHKLIKRKKDINTDSLKYLNEKLRNDQEVVGLFLMLDYFNLKYMGEELKKNKSFFMDAIKYNTNCLQYASDELKDDEDIINFAISRDSDSLISLGKKNGNAFCHASKRIQDKEEIFLYALDNGLDYGFQFVPDKYQTEKKFLIKAINNCQLAYQHRKNKFWLDKELALLSLKGDPSQVKYIPKELKQDHEVALASLNCVFRWSVIFTKENYINDLIETTGYILTVCSSSSDEEVLSYAKNGYIKILNYLSKYSKRKPYSIIKEIIDLNINLDDKFLKLLPDNLVTIVQEDITKRNYDIEKHNLLCRLQPFSGFSVYISDIESKYKKDKEIVIALVNHIVLRGNEDCASYGYRYTTADEVFDMVKKIDTELEIACNEFNSEDILTYAKNEYKKVLINASNILKIDISLVIEEIKDKKGFRKFFSDDLLNN